VKFTQITGALKSFNYTLDADQQSSLSNFAKSVINYKANSDLFVMNSGNAFYVANESQFKMTKYYPGGSYSNPIAAFNDDDMSSEEYFEAMVKYWSSTNIWG
jgi:hypothetical protein